MQPLGPLGFGRSPVMRALLERVERLAVASNPLLILGERGTGKTMLAQRIHDLSGRSGRYKEESVAGLQPHLELAELVGHCAGAFTGARFNRKGLIEEAQGGTFFLDEIGDASVELQRILLRLLERQTIRRVGESRDVPVDVRFLAATNADPDELVRQGRFRADLLDRFGYFVVRVPRLAERREDIIPLALRFLGKMAEQRNWPAPTLSPELEEALRAAPWPGNVRALLSACEIVMCFAQPGQTLTLRDFPPEAIAVFQVEPGTPSDATLIERVRQELSRAGGNKSRAARALGMSRPRLYRILDADAGDGPRAAG